MMRKNGSSALKSSRSVIVVVMMGTVYVHACAVRRAKSANLIGGAPVTFWTPGILRKRLVAVAQHGLGCWCGRLGLRIAADRLTRPYVDHLQVRTYERAR